MNDVVYRFFFVKKIYFKVNRNSFKVIKLVVKILLNKLAIKCIFAL